MDNDLKLEETLAEIRRGLVDDEAAFIDSAKRLIEDYQRKIRRIQVLIISEWKK